MYCAVGIAAERGIAYAFIFEIIGVVDEFICGIEGELEFVVCFNLSSVGAFFFVELHL